MATRKNRLLAVTLIVEDLARQGRTPAEIERELQSRAEKGEFDAAWIPRRRTLQRDVKRVRPPDPSGLWTFSSDEEEGAAFVLATLSVVIDRTRGRVTRLSNGTANWLQAIHAVAPELDHWTAFTLASMYQARSDRNLDWDDLDAWLAYGPWRGEEAAERYERAVAEGWVPHSPIEMNFTSRVIVAAAAIGTPEDRAHRARRRRKILTVEGRPIDPAIYEEIKAITPKASPPRPAEDVPVDGLGSG